MSTPEDNLVLKILREFRKEMNEFRNDMNEFRYDSKEQFTLLQIGLHALAKRDQASSMEIFKLQEQVTTLNKRVALMEKRLELRDS